ncbi:MAG: iron ABC transporter permease [Chitinophagia bacterium]|jgi:iron complex transport system permease protein
MQRKSSLFFIVLIFILALVLINAIAFGAVSILPSEMWSALQHWFTSKEPASIYESVFIQLRLPRVLLCAITGAILAVSGVLMQGLFRNPVVEPGLVGTSAGAAFGASIVFSIGPFLSPVLKTALGPFLVPVFAFIGGLLATYIVYQLAKNNKRVAILPLLLVGMAINAIGLSGVGLMTYLARDPQARSITFWNLGTFSGASWFQVIVTGIVAIVCIIIAFKQAKKLNVLLLGEQEARYLGVEVHRLKTSILIVNTAMVSVATSFVGVIAFMGLIVPHVLRLIIGSDNRKLIPASILMGALLLTLADMGARLFLAPSEIPIGIITSIIGAPLYIFLLKKYQFNQNDL